MQAEHRQPPDERAHGLDEGIGAARVHNGGEDAAIVAVFVVVFKMGVQQLVYDVAEALRHALAHKAARVFRGHEAAHVNQPVQRLAVPRAHVALQRLQLRQLALGVIDEGGEFRALALGHPGAQHPVHLFADDAGRAG